MDLDIVRRLLMGMLPSEYRVFRVRRENSIGGTIKLPRGYCWLAVVYSNARYTAEHKQATVTLKEESEEKYIARQLANQILRFENQEKQNERA